MSDIALKDKTVAMRMGRILMRRDREYWTQEDLARLEESISRDMASMRVPWHWNGRRRQSIKSWSGKS